MALPRLILLLIGISCLCVGSECNHHLLRGDITILTGSPFITVNGKRYSPLDGSLRFLGNRSVTGQDVLGKYDELHMMYVANDVNIHYETVTRFYSYDFPVLTLYAQNFPDGIGNVGLNDSNVVSTSFPALKVDGVMNTYGYLSYGGIMFGDTGKKLGILNKEADINSGLDGGPLVIFDEGDNVVVTSTFSQFMAASIWHDKETSTINWGIMGSMPDIPAGYEYWTIMYTDNRGINTAMKGWGEVMRAQYDRHQEFRYSDLTNNYLGYWTDNGAYYYYLTEPNKTYSQTIIDVKSYSDSLNIPYRYVQYDSWWYPKGPRSGVVEWVGMPSVFPEGMRDLWNTTGWPVSAHNRWWSSKTSYAKQNGGKYDFIVETERAMPIDQQFWDDLMRSSRKWGLITYEQDWLNVEFDQLTATRTQIDLGRKWLMQMGKGAAKNGLTIQYCMSPSRHALQTLEIPVVSQARVSGDYSPGREQWRIGISSMFADALGVAPFKDNFWTTEVQPGNKYGRTEPYAALNALVSTLSTGPVGPSDMIGATNVSLLMRCCNADGLILKPSKPAMSINSQIKKMALGTVSGPDGEVWSTYTDINDQYRFGIILAADLNADYSIGPTDAFSPKFPTSKYYTSGMMMPSPFSDTMKIKLTSCTKIDFCLVYTSPVITLSSGTEVIIIGELSKWVPVSEQRISRMDVDGNDVKLYVRGAVMEKVDFYFSVAGRVQHVSCVFPADGTAAISIMQNTCN